MQRRRFARRRWAVAQAQGTAYWDSNGVTAGAGSDADRHLGHGQLLERDSTGAAATGAWTSGDTAVFSAGADATSTFNVTVEDTQSVGGIVVEEGTVALWLTGTGGDGGADAE